MKKIALHWQIIIGMVAGLLFGYIFLIAGGSKQFVTDWISPIGVIFINLLKLIAIPLIIASLIKGIADLGDINKFSRIGGRTIAIYLATTLIATTIGLALVHVVHPGVGIDQTTVEQMAEANAGTAASKILAAGDAADRGPLQFVVDLVPDNIFGSLTSNSNMLQVIFFVIFFGVCLLLIEEKQAKPVKDFINGLNDVVLKMVDLIMLVAPYAVFALMASLVVTTENPDLFVALAKYAVTIVVGLALLIGVYTILVKTFTGMNPGKFFSGIGPAQLVAFSTSSSAATLPVTMERVEEHLGVQKEVTSFVCPVGATINMDGTSLYQAVAAVFITEVVGFDLEFTDLLTILVTATLASIGSAAVPSAGIVMLVIVLEAIGLPADKLAIGIALVFAVDRPLDMLRTVINVTGDATVSMMVAKSVGKLGPPDVKNWDDHYQAPT
ncbi:MAG: dicarboxylate/amino acid:cation symporter [Saprospiraceae bacterium]|nr:dicarboxylate/amino acid:cation symporter [Saprospiraceae bacterium]